MVSALLIAFAPLNLSARPISLEEIRSSNLIIPIVHFLSTTQILLPNVVPSFDSLVCSALWFCVSLLVHGVGKIGCFCFKLRSMHLAGRGAVVPLSLQNLGKSQICDYMIHMCSFRGLRRNVCSMDILRKHAFSTSLRSTYRGQPATLLLWILLFLPLHMHVSWQIPVQFHLEQFLLFPSCPKSGCIWLSCTCLWDFWCSLEWFSLLLV